MKLEYELDNYQITMSFAVSSFKKFGSFTL
jgi:hypothetical protein